MRIIQLLPTLSPGDAVGNDARAVCRAISEMGYKTGIYAETIDKRITDKDVHSIEKLPKLAPDDIVILNHCTGSRIITDLYKSIGGRKMMIYHNITPPKFFEPFSMSAASVVKEGYKQTEDLANTVEYVLSVSEYNASDLRRMGYKCPMFIRPILIPFGDYDGKPDEETVKKYSDGYTNILFVGRISPNKKQEDLIRIFAYYKKEINPKSRLILAGSYGGMERYKQSLENYADVLGVNDVIFTGHTSFASILAFYKTADVFLCMSEHEGFCVPLCESMYFEKPIIAYASSAIPGTLGGSGLLVDNKDPVFVSLLIDRLLKDENLKKQVIEEQNERLKAFTYERMKATLEEGLRAFIDGNYKKSE